jgi:hypothetical protein
MAVILRFASDHAKLGRRYTSPLGPLNLELRANVQAVERFEQRDSVGAGVDQCAHRHVSADPGERV